MESSDDCDLGSAERLGRLLQITRAIPWEADPETCRFLYIGPQAAALGYPVEQWLAPDFWVNSIHPEDRERIVEDCRSATQRGEDHEVEYRFLAADGRVIWFRDLIGVIEREGRTVACGFLFDVTEQKQGEARLLDAERRLSQSRDELSVCQARLDQQQRLRMLGELASGVAHDFNNALTPVMGYSEILLAKPNLPPKMREQLELIRTSAEDAAAVVARLLDFSRVQASPVSTEQVDLRRLLLEVRELTRPRWRDTAQRAGQAIEFELDLQAVEPVLGNTGDLRQVLVSLVLNAIDAMPAGGTLTLRLVPHGSQVELQVCDTGTGMPPHVRDHCFEPFFTTKGVAGTGLGLGICREIVARHAGTIDIESTPGAGTTCRVRLPRVPTTIETVPPAPPATEEPVDLHGYCVLVVEDDPRSLPVLRDLLQAFGLDVELADSPATALERFRLEPFDFVLVDASLAQEDDSRLAREILAHSPGTPLVYATGWLEPLNRPDIPAGTLVLSKPINRRALETLLVQVREQLAGRRQ